MKELSIEEKAKRYDEAINRMKHYVVDEYGCSRIKVADVFPELKESEDKMMVKFIKQQLFNIKKTITENYELDTKLTKAIDWLEKQGEQKPADKVEPKFHEGEWIVFNGLTLYVKEVVKGFYRTVSKGGITNSYDWGIDNAARLWTIQEARDGDVLIDCCDDYKNPLIFILKKFETVDFGLVRKSDYSSYCFLSMSDKPRFKEGYFHHMHDIKPATKEQRDQLEKAMADAGYTFDFEKKELRKIEHNPAWSEEDEKVIHCLEYTVRHFYEDEDTIKWCCDWLNFLKERYAWKPSDEQMNALEEACDEHWEPDGLDPLYTLYQDLKKLKG